MTDIFLPDYMESHVSAMGLEKVLIDLRNVVLDMAHENDQGAYLWLIEQDLAMAIQECKNVS